MLVWAGTRVVVSEICSTVRASFQSATAEPKFTDQHQRLQNLTGRSTSPSASLRSLELDYEMRKSRPPSRWAASSNLRFSCVGSYQGRVESIAAHPGRGGFAGPRHHRVLRADRGAAER